MLKLYYCRLPDSTPAVQTERLSAYRREKIEKQTNERVRLRSLTAELLLRHALRDGGFAVEGPLNIVVSEQGKPFLRDGGCFFSLSHSADAVLCALADRNVGADIQLASKASEALIGRFFSEEERAFVRGAEDPDRAFTEIWTEKESFCKMDGRGLALPLGSFSVFDPRITPLLWHTTAGEYHLALCSDMVKTERPEPIEVKTGVLFP